MNVRRMRKYAAKKVPDVLEFVLDVSDELTDLNYARETRHFVNAMQVKHGTNYSGVTIEMHNIYDIGSRRRFTMRVSLHSDGPNVVGN